MDEVDMCNPDTNGWCRCPVPVDTGPIIINKNYTYYPKAGMIKCFGLVVQTARMAGNEWGPHFIKDVQQIKDRESMEIAVHGGERWWATMKPEVPSGGMLRLRDVFLRYEFPSMDPLYSVCKIQRWIRRALKTRRQTRRLAFAMGMHARLGRQSAVVRLPADTLRLILEEV
jgi:hypothetical protein